MLLVLDIGNTNTMLGVFSGERLTYRWRIKTDRHKTEDEYGMLIKSLFTDRGLQFEDISGVIISSVVPPIMFALEKMCHRYFNIDPVIVEKDNVYPLLDIDYPNPAEIGADRIVNAIGGIALYGAPLIIIDFGTATTYCYVNEEAKYEGGIISPGIQISLEALYKSASKLPKVEIQKPENVIGRSTIEAMQSGVFYGYVSQVDGMVATIKKQIGQSPTVIATGGLAPLITDASTEVDYVDKYLTLKGLQIIYEKMQEKE